MEKALLAVILAVAVVAIVRIVRRSLAAASDSSPACAGCPFDSKCHMQDRPHLDECGGDDGGS